MTQSTERKAMPMTGTHHALAAQCARLASHDGVIETALPGVQVLRVSRPTAIAPVVYAPRVCIVAQGRKTGFVGEQPFFYDAAHYLVVTVPMGLRAQVHGASSARPFLAVSVDLDPTLLRDVALASPGDAAHETQRALRVTAAEPELIDVARRLLACAPGRGVQDDTAPGADDTFVADLCRRELYHRVLMGPQGRYVRALIAAEGRLGQLAPVLKRVHADVARPYTVASLAADAGMSSTVFHETFKAITGQSPLQYVKHLRLADAANRLRSGAHTVSDVAFAVGYSSPSQFSREFKRHFGAPPSTFTARAG